MASEKADFIKVDTMGRGPQTMPVEPEKRLADDEIRIEMCTEKDAEKVAEGLYKCFPESFWEKKEPMETRPADDVRHARMAERVRPSFHHPPLKWIKAIQASTGEIMGMAGWMSPENKPVHNFFRRDASQLYGFQEKMGWSDAYMDEIWQSMSSEHWTEKFAQDDEMRKGVVGDEPHWYLAPLMTWPEFQGRGVGSKLMKWATDQADATDPVTPMYLESAQTARAVYMHYGFVPQGDYTFLRRGPAVVRGLEAEEANGKVDKADGVA